MPMLCTLASGSSGNCTLVSDGKTHILIDAGISARRITRALDALGLHTGELSAVLLTHEHADHIAGLKTLTARYRVPVYASARTAAAVESVVAEGLLNAFPAGGQFEIGSIGAQTFLTPHDTPESVGYALEAGHTRIVLATDLGHVPEQALGYICTADILLIEANHDIGLLKQGPYPYFLKKTHSVRQWASFKRCVRAGRFKRGGKGREDCALGAFKRAKQYARACVFPGVRRAGTIGREARARRVRRGGAARGVGHRFCRMNGARV